MPWCERSTQKWALQTRLRGFVPVARPRLIYWSMGSSLRSSGLHTLYSSARRRISIGAFPDSRLTTRRPILMYDRQHPLQGLPHRRVPGGLG
jgi:hypothetical protein